MRVTWLGWAGVELADGDATLVIDPLLDPTALYAAVGDAANNVSWPQVTSPSPGTAVGALVTHLHRDHADAGALTRALAPGAPVLVPGERSLDASPAPGLAQATDELARAGLTLRADRALADDGARPVHDHRAAGRRRHRRAPGVMGG